MEQLYSKLPIFSKISYYLNQPFPEDNSFLGEVKLSVLLGFFIFLFLYAFKPFGIHRTGDGLIVYAFYFGAITSLVSLGYEIFLDYILRLDRQTESWTFGKWIISVSILICLIASANYVLMFKVLNAVSFSLKAFGAVLYSTVLIGIFPIVFFGALSMSRARRKNEALAQEFVKAQENYNGRKIRIKADDGEELSIQATQFLYAEAMQNYLSVHFELDGGIKKEIFRLAMKDLETQIADQNILRCHRSFIVNQSRINNVSGNAQGLKLKLDKVEEEIPVSRTYIDRFKPKRAL